MKKYVSIFLLTIFLFSATEVHQFLKLPSLVEHFSEHKLQNTDISFFDFLYLHYMIANVYDADYDKDMKLPFKTCDHIGFTSPILLHAKQLFISNYVQLLIPTELASKIFEQPNFISSTYLSSIWQPPKFC